MNSSVGSKTGQKEYDYFVKVVIVGDSAVGKTNLLLRFVNGEYVVTHITTIGIDFKVKTLNIDGKKLKIQLWDTAGQDRFRTITKTYYKGSAGIILVYSVTDRKSFNNIEAWMSQIEQHGPQDINRIIVEQQRLVSKEEGQQLAAKYGVPHIQTSAKEDKGVSEAFEILGKLMISRLQKDSVTKSQVPYSSHPQSQTSQPASHMTGNSPIVQNVNAPKFQLGKNQNKPKKRKTCC